MSKTLTCNLVLVSLLMYIILFILINNGAFFSSNADGSPSLASDVCIMLILCGSILTLLAWIGALVRTAQLGRWGWFVFLIIFWDITLLIYVFAGPTTPRIATTNTGETNLNLPRTY